MKPFDTITGLDSELIANLHELGYATMRPIQEKSIPHLLEGKDIIAQAKTGSGKTAAFGIPIITKIDTTSRHLQALILAPTRELAEQIASELRAIARAKANLKILTLCGGTPLSPQTASLKKGAHIVVGTPGRIEDHLFRENLSLTGLSILVLDEADRMLDMGFHDDILKIVSRSKAPRQSMLFSATFPEKIEAIAAKILHDPIIVKVDTLHDEATFEEYAYEVASGQKDEALIGILQGYKPQSVAIFCNTKADVADLTQLLLDRDFEAIDLQGDLDQRERNETLIQFSNGSIPILVATDVASRGLDIKNLSLVINFDLPFATETYTHRKGRSGRSGMSGIVISLFEAGQKSKLKEFSSDIIIKKLHELVIDRNYKPHYAYRTIVINGGKKDKLRAGDILGSLSKEMGIRGEYIGKIDIADQRSYVAIDKRAIRQVIEGLSKGKIKGKKYKGWVL